MRKRHHAEMEQPVLMVEAPTHVSAQQDTQGITVIKVLVTIE